MQYCSGASGRNHNRMLSTRLPNLAGANSAFENNPLGRETQTADVSGPESRAAVETTDIAGYRTGGARHTTA
jgi:hypothetical protein